MKLSLAVFLAVFSAVVGLLTLSPGAPVALADATKTTWFAGLNNPGGIIVNAAGDVVLTEGGTGNNDARLLATRDLNADGDAMDAGEMSIIADGLPSISFSDPTGEEGVFGVADVARDADGNYWILAPVVGDEGPSVWIGMIDQNGDFDPLADLGAYEAANDPDQDGVDSNPFAFIVGPDGMLYVNDSGGNDTLKVNPATGTITTYAVYAEFPNPTPIGPPTMDAVPTGIEVDQDGGITVIFLTGFPFPQGGAFAAALFDENEDGDALDPDEVFFIPTGATATTDLGHTPNGVHYAVEVSTDLQDEANAPPGALIQYSPNGNVIVMDGLIGPISMAVRGDDEIFVSELFSGTISRVANLPAATIDRAVELLPGWNLVTYTGEAADIDVAFGDVLDDVGIIYGFANANEMWTSFDPNVPIALNSLFFLETEQVVWVNVTADHPVTWYMEAD